MATSTETSLELVLRRERAVVAAGLGLVVALSWGWVLLGAGMGMDAFETARMSKAVGLGAPDQPAIGAAAGSGMASPSMASPSMAGMPMAAMQPAAWSPGYALTMFGMWWVMMVAMMLPSAAPVLLLYARIHRKGGGGATSYGPTGLFASGYVLAWGGFSLAAVGLQWVLQESGLLSAMMVATSATLAALILVAAGLWQLTPIKQACLRHCRSPISFIMHHWRPGPWGACRMGLRHGAYCLGCCWFLMALLFYGGVMNLYWIGGLAAFVLFEKTLPAGNWLGQAAGIGLIGWGGAVFVAAVL